MDDTEGENTERSEEGPSPAASEFVELDDMARSVDEAYSLLLQAKTLLNGYFQMLTPREREELLSAPHQLNEAGRKMIAASKDQAALLQACPKIDGDLVINRLDRVLASSALAEQAQAIAQMIDDTRRKLLSDSYTDLLSMYRVGKPMAAEDPDLQVVLAPFTEIYASRKRKPKKPK